MKSDDDEEKREVWLCGCACLCEYNHYYHHDHQQFVVSSSEKRIEMNTKSVRLSVRVRVFACKQGRCPQSFCVLDQVTLATSAFARRIFSIAVGVYSCLLSQCCSNLGLVVLEANVRN